MKLARLLAGIFNGLLLTLFILLFSCSSNQSFKVKGKITNSNNELVYLKEMTIADVIIKDSCRIDNDGEFVLKGEAKKIAFYTLSISKQNYLTLIIKPGDKIVINADAKNLISNYTISGSQESELIKELSDKLNETLARIDVLSRTYQDSLGSPNILNIRLNLDSIYRNIENDHKEFTISFINTNKNSIASVMALYQQIGPRKAVLSPTENYETFILVDSIMTKIYPEADAVRSLHSLLGNITEEYRRKAELEKRVGIGVIAPEISLPSFNDSTLTLSSFRGKYILVDFWASWCKPCRDENPKLLRVYWRYRWAGFDVFQVSLDKTRDAWLKAITTDGLPWKHVSDLKMWNSPTVALYGIDQIPSNLLLDKEGKIIAKNLNAESLGIKLKEIFKY
jgi:thiol-disulfide isomerase/thioredoxin